MGSEWKTFRMADISEGIFDGPHATPPKTDSGPIFLGISSLKSGRLDIGQSDRISDRDFNRWTKRVTPQEDDIVFSYETRLGEAAIIPKGLRCCLGRRLALIRPDRSKVEPRFLLYNFLSYRFQQTIKQRTIHGSTVDRIALKDFPAFPMLLPPLPEQRAIAHILGTLDDKIECNRRMNETLEKMAQAIFKSWFVDFDPVRWNMDAKNGKAVGKPPVPPEILKLFPDSFQESELGLIPKGWEVGALPEIIDFKEGPGIRNWQYTNSDEGTRFINIRCIKNKDLDLKTANRIRDIEAFGKYGHFLLEKDDIVVSTSGTLGRFAIVRSEHLPLVLNTSVIRMRPVAPNCTLPYLVGYAETGLQNELDARATGSAQKNFGPMHLRQISILIPNFNILSIHNKIAEPWLRKTLRGLKESHYLASLRDTLLPKLISGELRIKVAEKFIEALS